jgi:carbonic anhydrase/acetyltransferase-like protein (isoleucine patch superfamily)
LRLDIQENMALIKSLRGFTPRIGNDCYLAETAVIIGDTVIGDGCSIWFNTVLRGDVNSIRIGSNVNIQDGSVLHTLYEKSTIEIGDYVSVGHNVTIHGAKVGDYALIGMGATLLDHAVVGEGAIVAAGSLVLAGTVIEPHTLWAGVPARFVKKVAPEQAQEINRKIAHNYTMYAGWYKEIENGKLEIENSAKTEKEFDQAIKVCRDIFAKKLSDYGSSWRILRPESVTDQIFIKANRIRSIETKGVSKVGDDTRGEFIAIVNYGIIGLIQLEKGFSDAPDMNVDEALRLYDRFAKEAKELMTAKNHDYGEAWRSMRESSYTDLILQKLNRTKEIESNEGVTIISEGIDANYFDMINYAVFALIKSA